MKGVNRFDCQSYSFTKKYARIIQQFAEKEKFSLDNALDFFYHSEVYRLISEGVSDLHCMSDEYLTEELIAEYKEKQK